MESQIVSTKSYLSDIKPAVEKKFEMGDIVSLRSHPFQSRYFLPKIGAYAKFTPPLMIIIEVLKKTSHDPLTGAKDPNQYKCLFYSTREGKFEKLWFKANELKHIETLPQQEYSANVFNFNNWKKEFVGKEVILRTVDLELGKQKIYQDTIGYKTKMNVNNLLDFLPPIATIIDVKYEEDGTKHSEKDGKELAKKFTLFAKIKWLNNESGKFSEDTIPLDSLKMVEFNNEPIFYSHKKYYYHCFKDKKEMEGNPNLFLKAIPLYLDSVTFKHYYYVFDIINGFTNKRSSYSHKFPVQSFVDFNTIIEDGNIVENIADFFDIKKAESLKNIWAKIWYTDRNGNDTERIVNIQELSSDTDRLTGEISVPSLKCNCLLRDGAIRNFVIKRIQRCIILPNTFEEIFFERIDTVS